jgi:XTP/dITP diphosphohydrolase
MEASMSEPRLVIASGNIKKRGEIEELLAGTPCRVLTLKDFPGCPEVRETGTTFAENAALKATEVAAFTGLLTLADDSGLEVDALEGQPGIHSARFASGNRTGNASDEDNIRSLLDRLGGIPPDKRSARFVCAMTLARL